MKFTNDPNQDQHIRSKNTVSSVRKTNLLDRLYENLHS